MTEKEREQATILARLDARLADDELQLEERQLRLADAEAGYRESQERVYHLGSEVQRVENELLMNGRQRENLTGQDARIEGELETVTAQLKRLGEELLELQTRDNSALAEFERLQQRVAQNEEALKEKQLQEGAQRQRLEESRTELLELVAGTGRLANRREEIERRLSSEDARRQQIEKDADQIRAQQAELALRQDALQKKYAQVRRAQEELQEQILRYQEERGLPETDSDRQRA